MLYTVDDSLLSFASASAFAFYNPRAFLFRHPVVGKEESKTHADKEQATEYEAKVRVKKPADDKCSDDEQAIVENAKMIVACTFPDREYTYCECEDVDQ